LSAANVTITVSDPDLLIAGDAPYAAFVVAYAKLYRYASETAARADTTGAGGTLVTTFTIVASTVAASDPDIAGPYRYGIYDSSQTADSWYRYLFTDSGGATLSPLSDPWQSDNADQWALRDILFEVGDLLGGAVVKGTATAGGSGTVTCTALFKSTKRDARVYEGWTLCVTQDAGGSSAAPEGEEKLIDSIDTATGIATLEDAFSANVANGDIFLLSAYLAPSEMIRIINRAREKMKVEDKIDIAIASAEDRYPAPAGVKSKSDIISVVGVRQYSNSNREDEFEIDYKPIMLNGRVWLEFSDYPESSTVARVAYQRSYRDVEGPLTAMGDTTSCPAEWWRPAFAFAIAEWLLESDPNEPEYQRLYDKFKDAALAASGEYAPDFERPAHLGAGRKVLPGPDQVA